jgi:hypothetical protein
MRDFQRIDWKTYNRPPFYQQWLCRDDTLKLATFGDRGLAEADDQILALKDQWDLDNVKGRFLDRIGKLLSETRNGNTDEYYRILLKLRRLLNTSNGSIPSIIKAIKFIYSSETVHIVPDYPAGLIIEHDGEGTPGLNFNRLLAEIIPAGVSFSTKEIFILSEEFVAADALDITVFRKMADSFKNGLKYNGRGKYDGHTLNPTEAVKQKYNGNYKYDGTMQYAGKQVLPAESYVIVPFKYRSGIRDVLTANIPQNYIDHARSRTKYNGAAKYNGEKNYSGFGGNSFYDLFVAKSVQNVEDNEVTAESLAVQVNKPLDEHFTTHNRYDGYSRYNGEAKYRAAKEAFAIAGEGVGVTEAVTMDEAFLAGKRFLRKYDGAYKYDGEILYNGNVLIPVLGGKAW